MDRHLWRGGEGLIASDGGMEGFPVALKMDGVLGCLVWGNRLSSLPCFRVRRDQTS